ncbi:unnamed protein product [Medioppia subpectinata]|uniref:Phospholipase A2-like central domain-containing protein n=1 Tax=Medioppia subpectinata TaxID=1979941 RepID=A0A7R9PTB7_9ACAR|nr:unnamed protein product [Medioppia subpectinata]CAG2100334.1 unnamed protein product [Medioppia subpectinata]
MDDRMKRELKLTFPKTKWCGPGNTATGYDDLGQLRDLDSCCREHDLCPHSLSPDISHCECDNRLRLCLQPLLAVSQSARIIRVAVVEEKDWTQKR